MRNKLRVLLLALSSIPSSAFAGWYGGIGLGQSQADVDCGAISNCSTDDTGDGLKFYAGNQIAPGLGVEFGYVDLGEVTAEGVLGPFGKFNASIEATGLFAAVTGTVPLGQADLFGKVGLFRWDADARVSSSVLGSASFSESGTDPMLGLGISFSVNPNLSIRGEWERFLDIGNDSTIGKSDVDLFSVGLVYKF